MIFIEVYLIRGANLDMRLKQDKKYKRNQSKLNKVYFKGDDTVSSFYIGSPKSDSKLRVYDKKEEILHGRKRIS